MTLLVRSIRHAARRLLHAPAFTIAAIATLALGIGATTAVFSVVNAVLLRPLPYDDPERLVTPFHTLVVSGLSQVDQSGASYLFYRPNNTVFTDFGVYQGGSVNLGPMTGVGGGDATQAERIVAARVSAGVLSILRTSPLRGRGFGENDDVPGALPVALIGERLWERKYGRDEGIIGRRLEIDGTPHDVIGVMSARFHFPAPGTELWIPMRIDPSKLDTASFDYQGIARLRDGVSLETAAADLQRLLPRHPEAYPGRLTAAAIESTKMRTAVAPFRDLVVGDIGRVLWVVLGAVGFVFAIACGNVANLFLVRAEGRQKELAVRRTLGAGQGAILVEFLSEGIVIAALGGMLGLALAGAGLQVLRSLEAAADIPRLAEVSLDGVVLAGTALISALAALFVSAIPAMRARTLAPSGGLAATTRSTTAGRERHRARNALIVSQVALALVLLAGSGLMARSFARLRAVQPGFNPNQTLSFYLAVPEATYPEPSDAARFYVQALDTISAVPEVQAVGIASKLPLDQERPTDTGLFVEDRLPAPGQLASVHRVAYVSPDYFRAMGIPMLAGRTFERPDPPRVVLETIVSRAFADRYWKDESPIGKRLRIMVTGPWYTIVGVAGSVRGTALDQPPEQIVYCPIVAPETDRRWIPRTMGFVIRTSGDPGRMTGPIREAVRRLDGSLPMYRVRPVQDIVAQASIRTSFTFLLLGIASAVALALGGMGIYGVMSYVVSLRTREIGVRLALGAEPAAVRKMVSWQALTVAAVGIAIGLVVALAVTRVLAALLFEVSPTDPVTLLGAAGLLLAVALAASWVPGRRAAGVDPAQALRAE